MTGSFSQEGYAGTTTSNGGGNGDRGQIVVDVMGVQSDTGLIVNISENARNTRSAPAVMCVIYGNGSFICEQGKKTNEEEIALLRVLGQDFVNPALLDAHNHWQTGSTTADTQETNDYNISSQNGNMAQITFTRQLKVHGPQGYDASTSGKMTYNTKLEVVVSDVEETETRQETGQSYNRLDQTIALNLVSDSKAQTASTP